MPAYWDPAGSPRGPDDSPVLEAPRPAGSWGRCGSARGHDGLIIRLAGPADVDMVLDCQTYCWREAYTGLVAPAYLDDPDLPRRRRARWTERLAGLRHVLVAVGSATPGLAEGVASCGPSRDESPVRTLELMSLYVRARCHGTGVADRLLDAAIGDSPASLWVFKANTRATAFYRRHGFEADGNEEADDDTGLIGLRMVR